MLIFIGLIRSIRGPDQDWQHIKYGVHFNSWPLHRRVMSLEYLWWSALESSANFANSELWISMLNIDFAVQERAIDPMDDMGKRAGGTMLDISSVHKYRSFNRIWSRSAAILQSSINQLKSASRPLLGSFQQTTKRTWINYINGMVIKLIITLIINMTEICGVSSMISLHSVADKSPSNWWSLWSQPIKNCPLLCVAPSRDKESLYKWS